MYYDVLKLKIGRGAEGAAKSLQIPALDRKMHMLTVLKKRKSQKHCVRKEVL